MSKTRTNPPRFGARTPFVLGIDEVGRGPLAGPVTVAAVLLPTHFPFQSPFLPGRLRDSKRLSKAARGRWFHALRSAPGTIYAVSSIAPRVIDRENISRAVNYAAATVIRRLAAQNPAWVSAATVILDAGIRLPEGLMADCGIKTIARSLIKGDERIQAVALASIAAKVTRDRYMERLGKHHPQFGFERHKGYGTRAHIAALRRHGPTKHHRLTFLRNLSRMNQ